MQREVAQYLKDRGVPGGVAAKILRLYREAAAAHHEGFFMKAMRELQGLHPEAREHIMQRQLASWALHAILFTTFGKYMSDGSEAVMVAMARFAVEKTSMEAFPMLQYIVETVMADT